MIRPYENINPFAAGPACPVCNDIRTVTTRVEARKADLRKCPACGVMGDDEYERFKHDAWLKAQKPPEITQLDLTDKEMPVYKMLRDEHPNVSTITIMTWLESQRYNPAKDEEWLAKEARPAFRAWLVRQPAGSPAGAAGRKLKGAA